jgi:bacterioferritin B
MLISKGMQSKITEQVGNELLASHQYLLIATYFDGEGLPSLAQHFYKQSLEEREHALRFIKYLVDAGAAVTIPSIPAPKPTFKDAVEAVSLALQSEIRVTKQISGIVDLALKERDHSSKNMLEWFVNEQREEMSSMDTLLRMVKRAGESGMFFVDNFLLQGGLAEGPEAEGPAD